MGGLMKGWGRVLVVPVARAEEDSEKPERWCGSHLADMGRSVLRPYMICGERRGCGGDYG